jgi:hypothetical protein
MLKKMAFSGATPTWPEQAAPEDTDNLDFHGSLRELLQESGTTHEQLESMLAAIAERRSQGSDHLLFEEIGELTALSAERLAHLEDCQYCQDLVDCCCDPDYLQNLVQQAAKSSPVKRPRRAHPMRVALVAATVVLAVFSAFVFGKFESSLAQKSQQARYIKELQGLREFDAGAAFRAARLYSELNLQPQARESFLKGLRAYDVPKADVARVQDLTLDAEKAGWFERATARTEVAIQSRLHTAPSKSADDYLGKADLLLKAGKPTDAYLNILKYLASVDAAPSASQQFVVPPLSAKSEVRVDP